MGKSGIRYIVEKVFDHCGLKCVVIMGDLGHRCGYVGVPGNHRYSGVPYGEYTRGAETAMRPSIGWPEESLDVHGGITFSGSNEGNGYPIATDEPLWFFGYDCGHFGDAPDVNALDPELRSILGSREGVVRSLAYCIRECEKLAQQLHRIGYIPVTTNSIKEN